VIPRHSFYLDSVHRLTYAAFQRDDEVGHAECRYVQAYVVSAVLCSVSFLEVSINDLFEGEFVSRQTKFSSALRSVWSEGFHRQPTLAKYQIALALAQSKMFDTGAEPYQSADALITLRNTISHPKRIYSSEKEQEKLQALLKDKYAFREPRSEYYEFFPTSCLSPACAAWALFSAARFFKEFERRLPRSVRSMNFFLDSHLAAARNLLDHGYKERDRRIFGDLTHK